MPDLSPRLDENILLKIGAGLREQFAPVVEEGIPASFEAQLRRLDDAAKARNR